MRLHPFPAPPHTPSPPRQDPDGYIAIENWMAADKIAVKKGDKLCMMIKGMGGFGMTVGMATAGEGVYVIGTKAGGTAAMMFEQEV